jgi:D-glycero-alpha-D-manno-heptose-7-phosphate kinase
MQITARLPMRVDFAGGTLDVYPLYVFEGGGLTVNAAMDIMAVVQVQTREDSIITIHSHDLGLREEMPDLEALQPGGGLDLAKRALGFYRPEVGLDITMRSEAPRGSGIGASSSLLMGLSSCLNEITGRGYRREEIIDIGANIEAQVVGIPTGKQDYFPPIYGGVCSIWFGVDGWRLEALSTENGLLEALNARLIVSFTGIPHSSAVTNWAMLKAYIERQGDTVERMAEIGEIAQQMRDCLAACDMDRLPVLLDREWKLRKGLAEGVTTPDIDRMVAAAQDAGALASKICGAGGGGCMITLAPPERVPSVRMALAGAGARILEANLVADGLSLVATP